jgi:hypothetical protein
MITNSSSSLAMSHPNSSPLPSLAQQAPEPAEPAHLTATGMDTLIAKQLERLALKDREAINEEIHGVHWLAAPENPGLIREKLAEMEEALVCHHQHGDHFGVGGEATANIGAGQPANGASSDAYNEALLMESQYIHEPALRVMFLRAEFFDARKAAVRFVNFLQLIRDSLGPQGLVHEPWLFNTFTSEELKIYKKGAFQVFPGRDRVGRRVMGIVDDLGAGLSLVSIATVRRGGAENRQSGLNKPCVLWGCLSFSS